MAGMPRESSFMPTVKCSSCGNEVQISMMGEHVCGGPQDTEQAPPLPPPSSFDRFMSDKVTRMMPPSLDTSTANRSLGGQGQLTPVSLSSGSREESPKTPNGRIGGGRPEDYTPHIATDSPTGQQTIRRPEAYGGFGESDGYDGEPLYPVNTGSKPTANVLQRMNTIAPGPFDAGRRPSAAGNAFPAMSTSPGSYDRPGTSMSNMSSTLGGSMRLPRAPRNDNYGGFGAPQRSQTDFESTSYGLTQRSDTFPRASDPMSETPARTPSAPGPRPDRIRRPSEEERAAMPIIGDRLRRPTFDTSRPPPVRPLVTRAQTSNGPNNAGQDFGNRKPYHAATDSMSSSYSASTQRSGKPSQSSLESSPPRSVGSYDRRPSDASAFRAGVEDRKQSDLARSPAQPFAAVLAKRPPRPDRAGYDPRIAPAAAQKAGTLSPLASPQYELGSPLDMTSRQDPAIQEGRQYLAPLTPVAPMASPERMQQRPRAQSRLREPNFQEPPQMRPRQPDFQEQPQMRPPREPMAPFYAQQEPLPHQYPLQNFSPREQERAPKEAAPSPQAPREPPAAPKEQQPPGPRSRSRPRDVQPPTAPTGRGDCKSCKLPITGKSISSADGRLTGRYHKACFVCTTCQNPFSSATFYVLDDKPYCERDYHELNGSLCGGCGNGIEGQYLEDETRKKHHPGCFRCGDCGLVLNDGYFEVGGRAFCEKDAWRRVQLQQPRKGSGQQNGQGMMTSSNLGLPPRGPGDQQWNGGGGGYGGPAMNGGNNRLMPGGPPSVMPRMEKRMTRLGMM